MTFAVDWRQWSRDAVDAAASLNGQWQATFKLAGARYHWDLDRGEIFFEATDRRVVARICVVGTASESLGTFLWGWANDALPQAVTRKLEDVRKFGEAHGLGLLTTAELSGGIAQGKECAAISVRILGEKGVFIDTVGDVTLFFTLSNFHEMPAATFC